MKNIPLINLIETFVCSFGSMNHSICSNLCFDIFWGTGNADTVQLETTASSLEGNQYVCTIKIKKHELVVNHSWAHPT